VPETSLNSLQGLFELLESVKCLRFSEIRLDEGGFNLDGFVAVANALVVLFEFQLGVGSVRIINVVGLVGCGFNGCGIESYCFVEFAFFECLVAFVFYLIWILRHLIGFKILQQR